MRSVRRDIRKIDSAGFSLTICRFVIEPWVYRKKETSGRCRIIIFVASLRALAIEVFENRHSHRPYAQMRVEYKGQIRHVSSLVGEN